MNVIDSQDEAALEAIARRHGFSVDATRAMFDAVLLGNGSMAQFSHPEFGGAGQWMRGGMTMVGDMFNHRLKSAVDGLCTELASLAAGSSRPSAGQGGGSRATGLHPTSQASGKWWPGELGAPNSSGAQNGARYAYFAGPRRLAIDDGGQVTVYDTGEHRIGGVSQQQSSGRSLGFTSQLGSVDLDRLQVVAPASSRSSLPRDEPSASFATPVPPAASGQGIDVPSLIEQLADLQAKGILTAEEFSTKKAELLRRI